MLGVLDLLAEAQPDLVRPKAVLSDSSIEPDRMRWAGRVAEHPETWLSAERFQLLVDNLHRAAELARGRGFEPVFHSHAGSYIETGDEIRRLAEALDPHLCGLCLDTGHARFGGVDPIDLLRDYGSLVRHVHVKDCDLALMDAVRSDGGGMEQAWRRGVFCELGTGSASIEDFLAALRTSGYDGWVVVEQDRFLTSADTPPAILALQTRNRAYLRARGF
jgi:inosose dehydratase